MVLSLIMMEISVMGRVQGGVVISETKIRYCLHARKSTESDEMHALYIYPQVKEMTVIADRLNLGSA